MDDLTNQIRNVIAQGKVDEARELLKPLMNQPNSEVLLLAAQVAIDSEQRRAFLERALLLDPFNMDIAQMLNEPVAFLPPKPKLLTEDTSREQTVIDTPITKQPSAVIIILGAILIIGALFILSENNRLAQERRAYEATRNAPSPTPYYTPTPRVRNYTFSVARKTRTSIYVNAGDKVEIQATGTIRTGPFCGFVGPEGANDGIQFWCSSYSLIKSYRFGSLLYSSTNDDEWNFCGKSCSFSYSGGGNLEFEVNDEDQGNNSGAFNLEITVRGR